MIPFASNAAAETPSNFKLARLPSKVSLPVGDLDPHPIMVLWVFGPMSFRMTWAQRPKEPLLDGGRHPPWDSFSPKQHLDRFSRFCTAHQCDQHRQIDPHLRHKCSNGPHLVHRLHAMHLTNSQHSGYH